MYIVHDRTHTHTHTIYIYIYIYALISLVVEPNKLYIKLYMIQYILLFCMMHETTSL